MARTIISAQGIGYQLGDRYLLKDINWDIEEKSRWIIIGMNGSGKTTLLSILAGYQAANHGELYLCGQSYDALDAFRIRRSIGWVSSSFYDQVYQNETVLEIMMAGISGTYGVAQSVVNKNSVMINAKEVLKFFELEDRVNYPYTWLSKGEKQIVLIIRALLTNPKILVFDEPMTGLDVLAQEMMRCFIEKIVEQKRYTMLYVTHHFDEISPVWFDHCMLLRHGSIYRKGPIKEIFQSNVISDFLGVKSLITQNSNGYYSLKFNNGGEHE